MGNKWILATLTLVLGVVIGATVATRLTGKTGTEDLERTANLQSQVTMLKVNTADLQGQLTALKTNSDTLQHRAETCEAKFERSTFLYDGVVFKNRRWVIPVDIEPTVIGAPANAEFTHYDPKTQTETIHMKPRVQQ